MTKIMGINSSEVTAETNISSSPQYLDREEDRLFKQLENAQIKYKKEFSKLDELRLEVHRIRNTISNKTKRLKPEFDKWYLNQKELLKQKALEI